MVLTQLPLSIRRGTSSTHINCPVRSPPPLSALAPRTSGITGHHTLEVMILKLELEEEAAKKAKLREESSRRMSCVNNSDILTLARNVLNRYPRFSRRKGCHVQVIFQKHRVQCRRDRTKVMCCSYGQGLKLERSLGLPATLVGEKVVWCKAGSQANGSGGHVCANQRREDIRSDKGRKEEFIRSVRQRRLNKKMGARNQQRLRRDYYEMEPGTGAHRREVR